METKLKLAISNILVALVVFVLSNIGQEIELRQFNSRLKFLEDNCWLIGNTSISNSITNQQEIEISEDARAKGNL